MNSLAGKTLMALAAIAVPALAVAGVLGLTLINTVSEAESDVNHALSASRSIAEIRVMIEKEYGLVARLPAELDQAKVDVFVEVEPTAVSLFVRDEGRGFDPAATAADRRGVSESIRGRMSRGGGTATVTPSPGPGTEGELTLPIHTQEPR